MAWSGKSTLIYTHVPSSSCKFGSNLRRIYWTLLLCVCVSSSPLIQTRSLVGLVRRWWAIEFRCLSWGKRIPLWKHQQVAILHGSAIIHSLTLKRKITILCGFQVESSLVSKTAYQTAAQSLDRWWLSDVHWIALLPAYWQQIALHTAWWKWHGAVRLRSNANWTLGCFWQLIQQRLAIGRSDAHFSHDEIGVSSSLLLRSVW